MKMSTEFSSSKKDNPPLLGTLRKGTENQTTNIVILLYIVMALHHMENCVPY